MSIDDGCRSLELALILKVDCLRQLDDRAIRVAGNDRFSEVLMGVPREAAMRLINHSSELVHQVYQRENVDDVAQWRDAVEFPE